MTPKPAHTDDTTHPLVRRALSYMRTSTGRQSFERQKSEIAEFCKLNGYTETQTFADRGVSGAVPPWYRYGLVAAWDAALQGQGDVIVIADSARLTRSGPAVMRRLIDVAPIPLVFVEDCYATHGLNPIWIPECLDMMRECYASMRRLEAR